jgi:hypothetical protein
MSTISQLQVHIATKIAPNFPDEQWKTAEEGGYMPSKSLMFTQPVHFGTRYHHICLRIRFMEQPSDKTTKRKYQPIRELMKKILHMGTQHIEV